MWKLGEDENHDVSLRPIDRYKDREIYKITFIEQIIYEQKYLPASEFSDRN